jgi:hypothetical protein
MKFYDAIEAYVADMNAEGRFSRVGDYRGCV